MQEKDNQYDENVVPVLYYNEMGLIYWVCSILLFNHFPDFFYLIVTI